MVFTNQRSSSISTANHSLTVFDSWDIASCFCQPLLPMSLVQVPLKLFPLHDGKGGHLLSLIPTATFCELAGSKQANLNRQGLNLNHSRMPFVVCGKFHNHLFLLQRLVRNNLLCLRQNFHRPPQLKCLDQASAHAPRCDVQINQLVSIKCFHIEMCHVSASCNL